MAWADASGELLHQVTEELPLHMAANVSGAGQQQSIVLAWWCADRLLGATLDVMARAGESGLEHVCVTLVLAQDCDQWVWMHVPQLLAARLKASATLAQQLKRITVLNVAIDDPTLICQPQVSSTAIHARHFSHHICVHAVCVCPLVFLYRTGCWALLHMAWHEYVQRLNDAGW